MKRPDVHYVRSGDVAIAYQVVGEGPVEPLLRELKGVSEELRLHAVAA